MSVEAECYRAKIRLLNESTAINDHAFEVTELRIVGGEENRTVTDYTRTFEGEAA